MKQFSRLMLLCILSALSFVSCSKDYNDSELRGRIENLETWQKTVNSQISTLQGLVTALESNDYVTSVTPLSDKSGYVINFTKSSPITIKNGVDGSNGSTPLVSVKQDEDGLYYWTVDGEWLLNDGSKIRASAVDGKDGTDGKDGVNGTDGKDGADGADGKDGLNGTDGKDGANGTDGKDGANGTDGKDGVNGTDGKDGVDAIAPQVRINTVSNEWEISTDGGIKWTSTGVVAKGENGINGEKGDSFFTSVNTESQDYVVFTLANGIQITLPRYKSFKIGIDEGNNTYKVYDIGDNTIALSLPKDLKESGYTSIMAEVKYASGVSVDVVTRGMSTIAWAVKKITKPTFRDDGTCMNDASVTINVPAGTTYGDYVMLEVSLIMNDGSKLVASRVIKYNNNRTFTLSDYYQWDAKDPVNGTSPKYGTGLSATTDLFKACPTASQMIAYLKAGVYWDNSTVAEGQQSYIAFDDKWVPTTYHTGLWVMKRSKIGNSFNTETDLIYDTNNKNTFKKLSDMDENEVKRIRTGGDYFFLPAAGYKRYDNVQTAGEKGEYWSSTPSDTQVAYGLYFTSDKAGVGGTVRVYGYFPWEFE